MDSQSFRDCDSCEKVAENFEKLAKALSGDFDDAEQCVCGHFLDCVIECPNSYDTHSCGFGDEDSPRCECGHFFDCPYPCREPDDFRRFNHRCIQCEDRIWAEMGDPDAYQLSRCGYCGEHYQGCDSSCSGGSISREARHPEYEPND